MATAAAALPLARRRLRLHPLVTSASAAAAPFAVAVAFPRSRKRDVAVYVLHMWAYIVIHELPYDEPAGLARRVRVEYPIACDRALFGTSPTAALQRTLASDGSTGTLDNALVWVHWLWFLQPHTAAAWILWKHPERFTRTALMICSVFDIGMIGYFLVPTAPPWWAAERGYMEGVRRIMAEVGEPLWGRMWKPLYGFFGGNPLAAMPSMHFAACVMAAHMLAEADHRAGRVGWAYASTLGFALIYLGEHYVIDLGVGLALTESVRVFGPAATPLLEQVSGGVQALAARA